MRDKNPHNALHRLSEAFHHWLNYSATSQTGYRINPATQFSVICITGFIFLPQFLSQVNYNISHPLANCSPATSQGWWTSTCNQPLPIVKLCKISFICIWLAKFSLIERAEINAVLLPRVHAQLFFSSSVLLAFGWLWRFWDCRWEVFKVAWTFSVVACTT